MFKTDCISLQLQNPYIVLSTPFIRYPQIHTYTLSLHQLPKVLQGTILNLQSHHGMVNDVNQLPNRSIQSETNGNLFTPIQRYAPPIIGGR